MTKSEALKIMKKHGWNVEASKVELSEDAGSTCIIDEPGFGYWHVHPLYVTFYKHYGNKEEYE